MNFPFNIAINSQGNIFAANAGGNPIGFYGGSNSYVNTIEEFSPTFADLKTFASNLNEPYGVAFSAGDFLFVSNLGNNTIDVFTPSGAEQVYATAAQGLNKPAGLAFDSQGNLYVANEGNGTVEELFTDGSHVTIARGLANPVSIAISDLPLAAAPEPKSWLLGALAAIVFAGISRACRATRHRSPC